MNLQETQVMLGEVFRVLTEAHKFTLQLVLDHRRDAIDKAARRAELGALDDWTAEQRRKELDQMDIASKATFGEFEKQIETGMWKITFALDQLTAVLAEAKPSDSPARDLGGEQ